MKLAELEAFSEKRAKVDLPITLKPLRRILRGSSAGPLGTENKTMSNMKKYLIADNFLIPFAKECRFHINNAWLTEQVFIDMASEKLIQMSEDVANKAEAYNIVAPACGILESTKLLTMDWERQSQFKAFVEAANLEEVQTALLNADKLEILQDLLLDGDNLKKGITYDYLQKHVIPTFKKYGARPPHALRAKLLKLLQDLLAKTIEHIETCLVQPGQNSVQATQFALE